MSSVAVTLSSTATGASLTGVTVTVSGADVRQGAVGDGVVDAVGAVEVGRRGVGVAAVGGQHHGAAARWRRCPPTAVRLVPSTSVSLASRLDGRGEHGVFGGGDGVVDGDRGVVDRQLTVMVSGADVGEGAVGDGVGEAVGAVEVGGRGVGEAAVGGQHQGAALRGGDGARHGGRAGCRRRRCRWRAGSTVEVTTVSSVAVTASSTATGASLTGVTVMVTGADVREGAVGDGVVEAVGAVEVGGRGVGVAAVAASTRVPPCAVTKVPATAVRPGPSTSVSLARRLRSR